MPSPLGARQDSQWMAISSEPSIDYTWFGPARIPIPYTVMFDLSKSMQPSTTVKFNGKPAFLMDQSMQMQCMGDENGTGGGIHSGINLGEVKPTKASKSVNINGKPIVRYGDECSMNKGNCKGKYMAVPTPMGLVPMMIEEPVKVTQRLSKKHLCAEHPVAIEAIATPAGGDFEWSHSKNCQLVDASGKPSLVGKKLWLKLLNDAEHRVPDTAVHVTVTYKHPRGIIRDSQSHKTIHDLPFDIKWKIWKGEITSAITTDEPPKPAKMEFLDQKYALVVVGGTGTYPTREYEEMQQACNYTFKVAHSALIANSSESCFGTAIQSAGHILGKTIDPLAVETADAVMQGLRQKGEVYVVAHGQGTTVFAGALPLIKEHTKNDPKKRMKIHYQGFSPETAIEPNPAVHNLGSVRNVHNKKDPVPAPAAPSLADIAAKALTGIDVVSVPVQFSKWVGCQSEHAAKPKRHTFIEYYWGYLKTPSRGTGAPNTSHMRVSEPKQLAQDMAVAKTLAAKWAKASSGFSVAGKGQAGKNPNKSTQKKQVIIPCFMDGTGNNASSRTNIRLMFESLAYQRDEASNKYVIYPKYHDGPGADGSTLAQGTGYGVFSKSSREIVEEAYDNVVDQYISLKIEGYEDFKIDIYGFSRGAAIANELAWVIYDKGLKTQAGTSIVPPKGIKVRFLGLFETVHSMGIPGRDSLKTWHDRNIAPNVENCTHAFAADEDRVYFLPSVLQREDSDKGSAIVQMIFPGVHSDVGGHYDNNQHIMKVACSWMAENATKAGVPYLKSFILSKAEVDAVRNNPELRRVGAKGFPDDSPIPMEENPLYKINKVDEFIEKLPPLPIPVYRDIHQAAQYNDPFENQSKMMHERRKWEQYEIDWFAPTTNAPTVPGNR